MGSVISFILSNFTLSFLILGLVLSAAAIVRSTRPLTAPVVVEKLFFWFIFFSIGVAYVYSGIFHTAAHEMAAKLIGWPDSPFQIELGFASIGLGLVGLIAPWKSFHMRLAAVVPIAFFLWGAAGVHIHSMVAERNFEPGNAGVIFWTDVVVPIIAWIFLWLQYNYEKQGRSAAPYPNLRDAS